MKKLLILLFMLLGFAAMAQTIAPIANGESGASVRGKLNQVIDTVNTNFPLPLPARSIVTGSTTTTLNVDVTLSSDCSGFLLYIDQYIDDSNYSFKEVFCRRQSNDAVVGNTGSGPTAGSGFDNIFTYTLVGTTLTVGFNGLTTTSKNVDVVLVERTRAN